MDSIRDYYRESSEAHFIASHAASDPDSIVKTSAQLRGAAKARLDATEKEFNLKHQLHVQRMDKIKSDLDSKDLSELSRQVSVKDFLQLMFLIQWVMYKFTLRKKSWKINSRNKPKFVL